MAESHELGTWGEDLAVDYLKKNGYRILVRNFKRGKNEIDIVAETDEFIVFTEVKTRAEDFMEHPVNAISKEKQRSIIWAAESYIRSYRIDKESRFDVITIIKRCNDFEIDHIIDAFYPTLK